MRRTPRLTLSALSLALALTGCQAVMHEKGNILDPAELDTLRVGLSSRREVLNLLGSPTLVNTFRPNRWVYIQDRRFEGNRAVNRVEITFDEYGIISHIDRNFDQALMDPSVLPGGDTPKPLKVWERLRGQDPDKEVGVQEGVQDLGAVPQPVERAAGEDPDQRTWFEKYILRMPEHPVEEGAAEADTTFGPGEEGWWQEIWSRDPLAAGQNRLQSPENPPPPPPKEEESGSWWQFWRD